MGDETPEQDSNKTAEEEEDQEQEEQDGQNDVGQEKPDDKKFDTALIFLVIGGLFGFHHIYLKRTRQAVLYACTGGFFIVGLIYDMFNLETYISEANFDETFVENYKTKNKQKQNGISLFHCSIELIFGLVAGYAAYFALPFDWGQTSTETSIQEYILVRVNSLLISPLATAFGVWFVGGMGHQRVSLSSAICGALITAPILIHNGNLNGLFYTALFADFWANYNSHTTTSLGKQFDEQAKPYRQHVANYAIFVTAFYIICITAGVNNATVRNDVGELPFRDFIWNAVKTPDFALLYEELSGALRSAEFFNAFNLAVNGGSSVTDAVIFSGILGLDVSKTSIGTVYQVCDQLVEKNAQRSFAETDDAEKQVRIAKMVQACETLMNRYKTTTTTTSTNEEGNFQQKEKRSRQASRNDEQYQGEKFMKYEL